MPDAATVLTEVVTEVLERQAYMFGEACPKEGLVTEAQAFLHATMSFQGPARGRVGVAAPADLCIELAANVLGVANEEMLAEQDPSDAFGELLNVVCGHLLTALYDPQLVFQTSTPEVTELDLRGWRSLLDHDASVGLCIDDVPAVAYVRLEGGEA